MGGAGGSPGCCAASRTAPPPGQRLASAAPPDRHTDTCQLHTAHTPDHLIRNNQPASCHCLAVMPAQPITAAQVTQVSLDSQQHLNTAVQIGSRRKDECLCRQGREREEEPAGSHEDTHIHTNSHTCSFLPGAVSPLSPKERKHPM